MAVSAARSDVGRKRSLNEDSYVADDAYGLFVVADGMGGHAGGEVASQIAAETLKSFVTSSTADSGITWPFGFAPAVSIEGNQLRNAIQYRAYGQKDPLVVYKTEGYKYFQGLLDNIQHDVAHAMYRVQPVAAQQPVRTQLTEEADSPTPTPNGSGEEAENRPRRSRKVGVNDPCPCGSGKKYKHCHGAKQKTLV